MCVTCCYFCIMHKCVNTKFMYLKITLNEVKFTYFHIMIEFSLSLNFIKIGRILVLKYFSNIGSKVNLLRCWQPTIGNTVFMFSLSTGTDLTFLLSSFFLQSIINLLKIIQCMYYFVNITLCCI